MGQTKVIFIELNISNKLRHICDIVEKLYDQQATTTIFIADKKNAHNLDRQLWVWKQELFIPHAIIDSFNAEMDEAVIITTRPDFPVITKALVLFDPLPSNFSNHFSIIIDFAEVYEPERLRLSRNRYKTMRDCGIYEMHFSKLGAFLSTFRL